MAEDHIEHQLIKAARKIRHCGDYGLLFFNPRTHQVHWTGGDGDGPPKYTSMDEVKRILKVPGVTRVIIGDEWSPDEEEGWTKLEYRQGQDNPHSVNIDDLEPDPEGEAKFNEHEPTRDELRAMTDAIGKEFGDLGVGVEIEGEPLTDPFADVGEVIKQWSRRQITTRIDELTAQIAQEPDPVRKAALKREALRLMAQESAPQQIVRRLLE